MSDVDMTPGHLELVRRPAPAEGFGSALMAILENRDIPADKLQIVLQMQRELIAEQRREAFQTAFVAMSAELPQINKQGFVDLGMRGGKSTGYNHVLWEDMDTAIRPILSKYGFGLTFREVINGQHPKMIAELIHRDGHSLIAERVLIPDAGPGRNPQQAHGSSVSYAKRQMAMELCNIVGRGVDDDGVGSEIAAMSDEHVLEIDNLLEATGTNVEKFLNNFVTDCKEVKDIPERDYVRLKNALEQKRRNQANG